MQSYIAKLPDAILLKLLRKLKNGPYRFER